MRLLPVAFLLLLVPMPAHADLYQTLDSVFGTISGPQGGCMGKDMGPADFPGYDNMVQVFTPGWGGVSVQVWVGPPVPGASGRVYGFGTVCLPGPCPSLDKCIDPCDAPVVCTGPGNITTTGSTHLRIISMMEAAPFPGFTGLVQVSSGSHGTGLRVWSGPPEEGAVGHWYLYGIG